ncbi:MAG: PH domain-containing protein [Elusimicrobiota bacterium]|jgi:uncharacterized membrane protein YdbT with pleckstrin-like domain
MVSPEKLLWRGRPALRAALFELSSAAVLAVLAGLLLGTERPVPASVCAASALAAVLAAVLRRLRRDYRITSERLRAREGLLLHTTRELEFDALERLDLRRSLSQRLLGLGDVLGVPKAPDAGPLLFEDVADPETVLDAARRARRGRTCDDGQAQQTPAAAG